MSSYLSSRAKTSCPLCLRPAALSEHPAERKMRFFLISGGNVAGELDAPYNVSRKQHQAASSSVFCICENRKNEREIFPFAPKLAGPASLASGACFFARRFSGTPHTRRPCLPPSIN